MHNDALRHPASCLCGKFEGNICLWLFVFEHKTRFKNASIVRWILLAIRRKKIFSFDTVNIIACLGRTFRSYDRGFLAGKTQSTTWGMLTLISKVENSRFHTREEDALILSVTFNKILAESPALYTLFFCKTTIEFKSLL